MDILLNSSIDLLVVLGPTATGKTKLAVQLADKLKGEIISVGHVFAEAIKHVTDGTSLSSMFS